MSSGWDQQLFYSDALDEPHEWTIPRERGAAAQFSLLWYCGQCGTVYARCHSVDLFGRSMEWLSVRLACAKCQPYFSWEVPGSIWMGWDKDWTNSLPLSVLQREFDLHYEHLQKIGELPHE